VELMAAAKQAHQAKESKDLSLFFLENQAVSVILIAILVSVLSMSLTPSEASRVATALSSHNRIVLQHMENFIERHEIALIISAIKNSANNFVVVKGGNHMGKTIAVKAAASYLSNTRTVLWYNCTRESTMKGALMELYGVERNLLVDRLFGFVREKISPPVDVEKIVLSRGPLVPEPVLVIERAERLPITELKSLVDFAKELADGRLGRFIFVFSPSDKLAAISGYGAISRAKIIPVLDFTFSETMQYLSHFSYCASSEQASSVYNLIGGYLPHLLEDVVQQFCSGSIDIVGLDKYFHDIVASKFDSMDLQLGCNAGECTCNVSCAVLKKRFRDPLFIKARDTAVLSLSSDSQPRSILLSEHLFRASLQSRVYVIDSTYILKYIEQQCLC
jgi:hypothetical protein